MTLPDDLPLRELAFELFHLAHKLLLRVCDLTSKTERLRMVQDILPLSDRNAAVVLSGAFQTSVMLSLPHAVAFDVARRFSGEVDPYEEDVDGIVCDLANLLCDNLQSVMAERGVRMQREDARLLGSRLSLPPGRRVALVPFVTHRGQVLVSFALPG